MTPAVDQLLGRTSGHSTHVIEVILFIGLVDTPVLVEVKKNIRISEGVFLEITRRHFIIIECVPLPVKALYSGRVMTTACTATIMTDIPIKTIPLWNTTVLEAVPGEVESERDGDGVRDFGTIVTEPFELDDKDVGRALDKVLFY